MAPIWQFYKMTKTKNVNFNTFYRRTWMAAMQCSTIQQRHLQTDKHTHTHTHKQTNKSSSKQNWTPGTLASSIRTQACKKQQVQSCRWITPYITGSFPRKTRTANTRPFVFTYSIFITKKLQHYGHNKTTTTPETTNKKTSDNNTHMLVSLVYTHTQDSLGNASNTCTYYEYRMHTYLLLHENTYQLPQTLNSMESPSAQYEAAKGNNSRKEVTPEN